MKIYRIIVVILLMVGVAEAGPDPRLAHAFRVDKAGWIFVHLQGSPEDIGYQDGYLLAPEINDAIQTLEFYLARTTHQSWRFYRDAAGKMFWPKLNKEYRTEIEGIAEGLRARGFKYDAIDITALNGWMELAYYYRPQLMRQLRARERNDSAPGNCSAFIATGSYTSDGKIVMAHNCWMDYIVGERWNIIEDIVPDKGNRILMDAFPGFIDSGDDFAENSAGILITETTIAQFRGFDPACTPEFMRAREAEQYSNSIDDFVRIMTKDNNGAYANDWLVGDTKTNEIARLELGLKNHKVWRTKDGYFVGSNFPSDRKLIREETHFNPYDKYSSMNDRKLRLETLMHEYEGKIDVSIAEKILGDDYDQVRGREVRDSYVICGHNDEDPRGVPQWGWSPFNPAGAVQGKVTTTDLAKKMELWAHMGHPDGTDFIASEFFRMHPGYRWEGKYLHNMTSYPWTLFSAAK
ncbi:MAG: phospholipase B family protein [Bacteroidetes bacterium]|nr:phospholipase B family protein [Bacteroidota bacterium]